MVFDIHISQRFPANIFPQLLLTENWQDQLQQQRAQTYFEWCAPLLLTLPELSYQRRQKLELIAAAQPQRVEKCWRVYPEIINQQQLNTTRVQASLEKSL